MQDCNIHAPTLLLPAFKLSICISTINRAKLLRETLESIVSQATDECEVLILDASSTDGTENVASDFARRCKGLRYVRQGENNGFDRDIDRAVELARGEYCWLMSDDDHLKPSAVDTVLKAISRSYSLVLINIEAKSEDMSQVIWRRCLEIDSDCIYGPTEIDGLFTLCKALVTYVGSVVIKRELWRSRNKERYYNSAFVHVGVLFQEFLPEDALVIAKPLISIRIGNQSWFDRFFEILVIKLPAVTRSLAISESVKASAVEPWRNLGLMFFLRAMGSYSLVKYQAHIRPFLRSGRDRLFQSFVAVFPARLANTLLLFHYSVVNPRGNRRVLAAFLKKSPFYVRNWRL